jgi:hypothetical protein
MFQASVWSARAPGTSVPVGFMGVGPDGRCVRRRSEPCAAGGKDIALPERLLS